MILYLSALGAVVGAMYASASMLAPAVQTHFLQSRERPQSRLDVLIANAREVRQALATPIARVEPLPPITAKPLREEVAAKPVHKVPNTKLSAPARDAFAWSDTGGSRSSQMSMAFDRHRPQ